ncbi:WhiB family transcriptional regulator [Kitasatospora cinereorecta]|uniref:WhiB family transcriptional regulator n=1 Tax=Kitasatospora cinereorecta TaxID=285560 RepID=A0ABW0VM56_9ACTN
MTATTGPVRHRSLGDHAWQGQAACNPTEIATAKALCAQCTVRRACLDAALEAGDTHGIRGGLTEEERDHLHTDIANRLDYSRVNATLAGRDVHLTNAERRAVVLAGYRQGVTVERLAWLLKITEEHALKLYRETRRAIRHREIAREAARVAPAAAGIIGQLSRDDFGTAA